MAPTSDRVLTPLSKTILLTAAPLALVLLWAVVTGTGHLTDPKVVAALSSLWRSLFWSFAGGSVVALGLLGWRLQNETPQSVDLDPLVARIAAGDFAGAAKVGRRQGVLSQQAEQQLLRAGDSLGKGDGVSREQRDSLEKIALEVTALGETLMQQLSTIDGLLNSAKETAGSQSGMDDNIDGLAHSAEESSSSVLEMVAINNEVRENIHNLAMSVQETTTAIEEMAFSSKEVARNIEELSTAAEETAASMNQMDVSISQVETNANETSKLSETVTRDAETGVAAINHTIHGIDKIKESSRVAAEVITNLGQKINEIGNILNVIDDVAEQTNLLALNAAIIAAQAGEHGRGFAVVADEIKALAERTGASTKEIAGLIKNIQDESRNAVSVMSRGVDDVEEGVRLGHNAEDALRKIVESAKRSTLMIQAIAQATVEQAKGSKQVTNAISRIAETVQQIAYASAEQAKGSEHIMQSAERMKMITQQVERSADEQNRGGRQVTDAIETIREIAERISTARRAQARGVEQVTAGAAEVKGGAQRAVEQSQKLERILGDASRQLDAAGAAG